MNDDKENKKEKNKDTSKEKKQTIKKITKKHTKDKCLYTCENILNSYEYKKMAKYFPNRMYWVFVIRGAFLNLLFSALIAIFSQSWTATLSFLIIYQVYLMIFYKVRLEHLAEKVFNERNKRGEIDTNLKTEFYGEYFIRKGDKASITINYSEISRCVENDTNFYLEYPQRNMIVIIQKNLCELELINFIRDTFKNLEKRHEGSSKIKITKNYSNPNFIKKVMTILFVITIVSLWLAIGSFSLVNQLIPRHYVNQFKNMWIFWCWLPIPILSIILGFKFNKSKINCTKNIVAGFIVGFLLVIFGSFSLLPTYSVDYKEIDLYRDIIDAKLPNNGELVIENWDTCSGTDRTECTIINSYYNNEDVSDLVNSIENSNNWFLSTEIKSALEIMIPLGLFSDEDAYFSIYNKTTNQYNALPETSGNYEIYAMKYDKSEKHLEIYKYKYSYK